MIIMTADVFPEKMTKKINILLEEQKENTVAKIELVIYPDSNKVIHPDFISTFMAYFTNCAKKYPDKTIFISLINIKNLTFDSVSAILDNDEFRNHLNDNLFLELIVSSYQATEFTLTNQKLIDELESIVAAEDEQIFPKSCAARSLLMALKENKMIAASDYTRANELRIYREIWSAPGQEASPDKLMEYIKEKKYLSTMKSANKDIVMNITPIELNNITNYWLDKAKLAKSEKDKKQSHYLLNAYSFFKTCTQEKYISFETTETNKIEKVTNSGSMLLVETANGFSHVLFAKNKNGVLQIKNPSDGGLSEYKSFIDYCASQKGKFSGIGFHLT